jgi:hypothetical protein
MRLSWRTIELQCKRAGCLALVLMLAACQAPSASRAPRTPFAAERDLGTVAFVALPLEPQVELKGFASGKGSGALGTAGTTFAGCMGQGGSTGGCSGGGSLGAAICGAAVLMWLGACTVATGVGAIAGATMSDTAGSVQANVTRIKSTLDAQKIQEGLRDQVAKAAAEARAVIIATLSADAIAPAVADKDYRALAAAGVDNVIETSLTKIGTLGSGFDPPLTLYMLAHVRIIDTHDNSERFASNHSYVSEQHLLREWAADQGALLQRGLQTGFIRLGTSIADRVLREYSFPSRQALDHESIGLAAIYPKTTGSSYPSQLDREANWNKIDSLQPTLQWQSFPREADRAADPEEMARVRDVRYDILVAEEMGMAPGAVIASAYGIEQTSYRLERELQPAKKYFWTVRASFELDGKRRVTPWAMAMSGMAAVIFKVIDARAFPQKDALWALAQPSPASYRFQTPLAPGKSSQP